MKGQKCFLKSPPCSTVNEISKTHKTKGCPPVRAFILSSWHSNSQKQARFTTSGLFQSLKLLLSLVIASRSGARASRLPASVRGVRRRTKRLNRQKRRWIKRMGFAYTRTHKQKAPDALSSESGAVLFHRVHSFRVGRVVSVCHFVKQQRGTHPVEHVVERVF